MSLHDSLKQNGNGPWTAGRPQPSAIGAETAGAVMTRTCFGLPGAVWRGMVGKVRRRGGSLREGYGMEAQGNVSLTRRTTHSSAGAVAPAFYSSAVTRRSNLGK